MGFSFAENQNADKMLNCQAKMSSGLLVLGIDATNIRHGGGRTHLLELLSHAKPRAHGFSKVVVWGSKSTLALLPDQDWLIKLNPHSCEGGLIDRLIWQYFGLAKQALVEGCNLLFAPGGNFGGNFRPVVTMSQNMLPFDRRELIRYRLSSTTLKLIVLRWMQSRSFKKANAIIFLTRYSAKKVQSITGQLQGLTCIIPHGVNSRFHLQLNTQKAIENYDLSRPYRLLYVSIVDQYKHQWHVVDAIDILRQKTGWPLTLDLVGPAYPAALRRLQKTMAICDLRREWVKYHGSVPYKKLHTFYAEADLGVFASSCENMPNILLEAMAAGLPMASSDCGPMPEVLGNCGVYFDPENSTDIAATLERLIADSSMRAALADKSSTRAQQYSWTTCADQTFTFMQEVYIHWAEKQKPCAG